MRGRYMKSSLKIVHQCRVRLRINHPSASNFMTHASMIDTIGKVAVDHVNFHSFGRSLCTASSLESNTTSYIDFALVLAFKFNGWRPNFNQILIGCSVGWASKQAVNTADGKHQSLNIGNFCCQPVHKIIAR